jgi:hypothetical protein
MGHLLGFPRQYHEVSVFRSKRGTMLRDASNAKLWSRQELMYHANGPMVKRSLGHLERF